MKCKYRLKTKKPLVIIAVFILVILIATFYGCNQAKLTGLLDNERSNSAYDYKSTSEMIREQALESAKQQGLLILVNKQHPLAESYIPDDLTAMKYFVANRSAETRYMRKDAAAAFDQLVVAAARDGVELRMTTAYRSYEYQTNLYNTYVENSGEKAANHSSAKPGESEHQTGLAVDVSSISIGYQFLYTFGDTKEGKWLANHSYEFGFIIRYPAGKSDITGYNQEPWHLRYVGLFVANEIFRQGVTLEEYLADNSLISGEE